MPITFRHALLVIVALLSLTGVRAQDTPPADDYAEAMRLIIAQRHDEAAALLARIVDTQPEHAGALLDLAIVQCTLGRPAAAARLLAALAARFAPPPAIVAVMDQLQARGCAPAQPQAKAAWALGVARGYDNNASQGARVTTLVLPGFGGVPVELPLASDYLPRADHFSLFSAEFARSLPGLEAVGMRGFAQWQARVHDALGQYDTAALLAGAELPWRLVGWQGHVAAAWGALRLGDRLYQRQTRAMWLGRPPLMLPAGLKLAATAELTVIRYPGLDNFDSMTREAGGLLEWRTGQHLLRMSAAGAADQALGERPGGDRTGWQAAVQAGLPAGGGSFAELGASRRVWRGATAYAPGLIDTPRDQTTDVFVARLTKPLAPQQAAFAELRITRNRESIPVFAHDSRQLMVGWEWRGK